MTSQGGRQPDSIDSIDSIDTIASVASVATVRPRNFMVPEFSEPTCHSFFKTKTHSSNMEIVIDSDQDDVFIDLTSDHLEPIDLTSDHLDLIDLTGDDIDLIDLTGDEHDEDEGPDQDDEDDGPDQDDDDDGLDDEDEGPDQDDEDDEDEDDDDEDGLDDGEEAHEAHEAHEVHPDYHRQPDYQLYVESDHLDQVLALPSWTHRAEAPPLECPICQTDQVAGHLIRALPCGHLFHQNCVDRWLCTVRPSCPLCRAHI